MTISQTNYQAVIENIKKSALETGRNPKEINLVVVSKTFKRQALEPILKLGHRTFGENKVQEAEQKWLELKKDYPEVKLHLIGTLQTNKAALAISLFDVIETLDRPKLAVKLADELKKTNKEIALMIQVNTGEEQQKAGVLPQEADDFIQYCIQELKLPVKGLMCIPPFEDEPSLHFALLNKIAQRNGLKALSMGMSGDYQTAVKLGATEVRIGSAILGGR